MKFRINTLQDAAAYDQRVVLDGVSYTLGLAWNGRSGSWSLSLYDAAGAPLVLSRKLITNAPLLLRFSFVAGIPPGDLWAIDPSGSIAYAGYDELGPGRGVTLYYFDAEEMAGIRAAV